MELSEETQRRRGGERGPWLDRVRDEGIDQIH